MTATLDAPRTTQDTTVTLTIARQALRTALTRLSGAVGSGVKALPVTHYVKIQVRPGSATFTATDFDTWAQLTVSCAADGEATVLLPAKRLAEIVANLPPVGAVSLALGDQKGVLSAGRSVFEIAGLALSEFPLDLIVEGSERVMVNAAAFLDALGRVLPFASTAESRSEINVVRFTPAGELLHLSAFEGHCLARLAVPTTGLLLAPCSLHRTAVPVLTRLFSGLADDATLSLGVEETRLLVASEDATAILRLVDKPFPEYDRAIASLAPVRTLVCDRVALSAAIRRVALVASLTRRVDFSLDDELTVRASDSDRAIDVVPIERQAGSDVGTEARTVSLNGTMALAALDTIGGNDVAIAFESPSRPITFRPADATPSDPTLVLVQPLRTL